MHQCLLVLMKVLFIYSKIHHKCCLITVYLGWILLLSLVPLPRHFPPEPWFHGLISLIVDSYAHAVYAHLYVIQFNLLRISNKL